MSALPDGGELKQQLGAQRVPAPPALPLVTELSPRPPAAYQTPDALGLLRALKRRLWLALGTGIVCAVAAAAVAWSVVPPAKYTARSTLQVAMFRPKIIFETAEPSAEYKTFQKTQMAFITSRLVLGAVLQTPEVVALDTVKNISREQGDPVEWLEKQVAVEFPGGSEILQVSLSGENAKDVKVLVNCIVDMYIKHVVEQADRERKERISKLRELWIQYQDDLRKKRDRMRKLAVEAGSDDKQTLAFKNQLAHETLAQAKQEQLRIRSELSRAKAEAALLEQNPEIQSRQPTWVDEEIHLHVEGNPAVVELKNKIATLTGKYNHVSRLSRTSSDPAVVAVGRELETTRAMLVKVREQVRTKVVSQFKLNGTVVGGQPDERPQRAARIKMLEEFEKELTKEADRLTEQIGSLNVNTLDLESEQAEIALLADTAKKVGAEVEAMEVELQAPNRIRVVDKAAVPRPKDELRKAKASSMAAVGTFACVLVSISFWEFRSRRISSVDEVVYGLGLPLIGAIPPLPVRSERRLSASAAIREKNQTQLLVDSVDAARMMLLYAQRTEGLRVIMVTSAMAGEGKTSLSGHLASSMARAGRKTLLVDCDLRSPAVHRLFDLPAGPGLCELLRGDVSIADLIRPTPAAGLYVITAGRNDVSAIQSLARGELQSIFDTLETQFDLIVVDSAPVLAVSDTLAVSQHVDAVIFSILRDVSRVPMVQDAYRRLTSIGVRVFGAVVAGVPGETYRNRYSYPAQS